MAELHRFLREQDPGSLNNRSADGFESHLVPVAGSPAHFELHRIRIEDLPSERREGVIVDLNSSVNELAEGSHFLALPNNLLAFVGTGFSPRPGRLASWLRSRIGWNVWLEPVIRPDAGEVLDNLRRVTSVEVKISAEEARRLDLSGFFNEDDDPLGALLVAQRARQGGIITVGWSVGRDGHADQSWFTRLVERLRNADLTSFRSAKAKVYVEDSDNAVPIDFIHDKVVVEVEVDQPPGRQRLLPPSIALELMQEAWEQVRGTHGGPSPESSASAIQLGVPPALIPQQNPSVTSVEHA